jgi:hypothetical protein
MSSEENKDLIRRYIQAIDEIKPSRAEAYATAGYGPVHASPTSK